MDQITKFFFEFSRRKDLKSSEFLVDRHFFHFTQRLTFNRFEGLEGQERGGAIFLLIYIQFIYNPTIIMIMS